MTKDHIKVLHLVDSGLPGGNNTFVLELLRAIDRSRFRMGVCSWEGDGPVLDQMRQAGAEVFTLKADLESHFGPGTIWRYFRHIRSRGYQIVHANLGARIPRSVARLAGCRTIAHVHGPPEGSLERIRQGDPALTREFKIAFGFASDWIVASSQYVSEMLAGICPVLMPRVCMIYSALDLDRWRPLSAEEMHRRRRAVGIPDDALVVGFAGRLIPLKRPDCLLAAAEILLRRHPHLHFWLLGDGPLRPALQKQASWLGDRVHLLGWQPGSDWLPLFDILAQPSEAEALGFSIREAMACARPVVATAVGGIPEAVIDGQTGLLVPPDDSQALATALDTLIQNPIMRCEMGLAGRRRAELLFDCGTMARKFEELYGKLHESRGRAIPSSKAWF
jgi:glycosyltransferase involved in cell wall biosynthesis